MSVTIREAVESDHDFVVDMMEDALSKYYDGDHSAHANRIFSTHISGGKDRLWFFSHLQKMYIAEVEGHRAGMIHIVGKRQDTVKISPLIVLPRYRYSYGVGKKLLEHAESVAKELGARQLYCTVALQNVKAVKFFQKNGFTKKGESDSHYKLSITEIMLHKLLVGKDYIEQFDRPHISVLPFEKKYSDQVRKLLLEELPNTFKGIDDNWVNSLFEGYERRSTQKIEAKFKLIFIALDPNENVLGVVGATPKKGKPIKLMPFIAKTTPAFVALLKDVPFHLHKYGRKLYIHISPTVEETIALQDNEWELNAVIPAGYHPDKVTQQWSFDVDESSIIRTIRVKEKFLKFIKQGKKDLEVRVGYKSMRSIKEGEVIELTSQISSQVVKITRIKNYSSFNELLENEDPGRIVPGYSKAGLVKLLQEIYPAHKEKLGVLVFQLQLLGGVS